MTTTTDQTPSTRSVASDDLWFAGTLMRVLADRASTGGQFALIEQHAPRGFSPPLHVHAGEDQMIFVVEGELRAQVGDAERLIAASDVVWLPRGVPHTFRVESDGARLIEVTTPAGFEDFHREAGEPALERRIPDPAPLDVAALAEASARHACQILGPPMD